MECSHKSPEFKIRVCLNSCCATGMVTIIILACRCGKWMYSPDTVEGRLPLAPLCVGWLTSSILNIVGFCALINVNDETCDSSREWSYELRYTSIVCWWKVSPCDIDRLSHRGTLFSEPIELIPCDTVRSLRFVTMRSCMCRKIEIDTWNTWTELGMGGAWPSWGGYSPASHRGVAGSIPGQVIWNLLWIKWHVSFPYQFSFHQLLPPHSLILSSDAI
jgi:hypothetical protein